MAPPLAAVIAERLGDAGGQTPRVPAASVAVAVRIGLESWLRPGSLGAAGLVIPGGSLPDQLRAVLEPLAPAFDAAERRAGQG